MERTGECLRCGNCCKKVVLKFGMEGATTDLEMAAAQDFLRWAALHEGVSVKQINEREAEVIFEARCSALKWENGEAVCTIYEDRPQICRGFPDSPTPNCPGFRFEGVKSSKEDE